MSKSPGLPSYVGRFASAITAGALGLFVAALLWLTLASAPSLERSVASAAVGPTGSFADRLGSFGHTIGPPYAPIKLTVLLGLHCGFSAGYARTLDSLLSKWRGQIAISVVLYLGPSVRDADKLSLAGECAAAQGKFRPFLTRAFDGTPELRTWGSWVAVSHAIQLADPAAFAKCVNERTYGDKLQLQSGAARSMGVVGTPTTLLRDRAVFGAMSLGELEAFIRRSHRLGA